MARCVGVPLPDVDVRIVDADDGVRELGVDEVGEMILRAPQGMAEYWDNPSETADTLRTHADGNRWVHTGDLARMDADDFVFIGASGGSCIEPVDVARRRGTITNEVSTSFSSRLARVYTRGGRPVAVATLIEASA